MNTEAITKVCKSISARYPRLEGKRPKVTTQGNNFLLTFKMSDALPDGKSIEQTIRVIADAQGNTLKVSTSKG